MEKWNRKLGTSKREQGIETPPRPKRRRPDWRGVFVARKKFGRWLSKKMFRKAYQKRAQNNTGFGKVKTV